MIEKFIPKEQEIEISILPKVKPHMEWAVSKGDTIVAFCDFHIYGPEETQELYKLMTATFPDNQILILPNDVMIGVMKDD